MRPTTTKHRGGHVGSARPCLASGDALHLETPPLLSPPRPPLPSKATSGSPHPPGATYGPFPRRALIWLPLAGRGATVNPPFPTELGRAASATPPPPQSLGKTPPPSFAPYNLHCLARRRGCGVFSLLLEGTWAAAREVPQRAGRTISSPS
uniref:Uncharacterized protein n=1 Tax=Sphaerodactylus townsendi TaxID=933632 RepID=A0ACB8F7G1_9SAUR